MRRGSWNIQGALWDMPGQAAGGGAAVEQPDLNLEPEVQPEPALRDHEEEYGELSALVPREITEGEAPPPRRRHRSKSSQASADEAGRIPELTGKLRTAEEELAIERAKRQELEQQLQTRSPVSAPQVPSPPEAPVAVAPAQSLPPAAAAGGASGFTEPEPKIDQFMNEPDPWLALNRAVARWDRRKDEFEAAQAREAETERGRVLTFQRQERERIVNLAGDYQGKALAFAESHPDFGEKLAAVHDWPVTPLIVEALFTEGPEIVYSLVSSPHLYDELVLQTANKPVTPELLASTRRLIRAKVGGVAAGATGAAPPQRQITPAPRPATPVRTGPVAKGDEPPPETGSLADHEAYYEDPSRSRRRR